MIDRPDHALGDRWFAFACTCLFLIVLASCSSRPVTLPKESSPSIEQTWQSLIDDVRTGKTSEIEITEFEIEPEQWPELENLTNLRTLKLDRGGLSDEAVERYFQGLDLHHLRARQSPVTDQGFRQILSTQKSIRILNLPHAVLTPAAFEGMETNTTLTSLRLGGSGISDQFVQALSERFTRLQHLHLIGPSISADSLRIVARMDSLHSFYLDDCQLPDDSWESLIQSRPGLHIHIDQSHHDRDANAHRH